MTDERQHPSLREQKKEETRHALSRAAAELLLAEGNEGMTVAAIAERAGVSTRTFHNYFPRREDALLTFIEYTVDELRERVSAAPAGESPLATMHRLIAERVDDSEDDSSRAPGTLLNLMAIGDHLSYVTGPEDKERVLHLLDGLLEALYLRDGHNLSRQGTALLLIASLTAGAIAVEGARRQTPEDTSGCFAPWALRDSRSGENDRGAEAVLDESFVLLRDGFGG
jgi:AcrR family transcriptional regulator